MIHSVCLHPLLALILCILLYVLDSHRTPPPRFPARNSNTTQMPNNFADLMALSATQTRATEATVAAQLEARKAKAAQQAKDQASREAKAREEERLRRERYFANQEKEKEKEEKRREEMMEKERVRERREEKERDRLRYGNNAASKKSGAVFGKLKEETRNYAREKGLDNDGGGVGTLNGTHMNKAENMLTREELRERRAKAEEKRMLAAMTGTGSRRGASGSGAFRRTGTKLRGGVLDIEGPLNATIAGGGGGAKTVRERIAAMPITLTKLNTNKRDTRTIDEIVRDREKEKRAATLEGDAARSFDGWFDSPPKKDREKKRLTESAPGSRHGTPSMVFFLLYPALHVFIIYARWCILLSISD
jgi:protein SPT2